MSFRCDFCGEIAPQRTVQRLVTTKTRTVSFSQKRGTAWEEFPGTQIVEQKKQCVNCFEATDPEGKRHRLDRLYPKWRGEVEEAV